MVNHQVKKYKQAQNELSLLAANPHEVIQVLMKELMTQLYLAKAGIERADIEARSNAINKAINLIGGLKGGLNMDAGGDIADNLDNLYNYMTMRLSEANLHTSVEIIEEIKNLFLPIKEAWDGISEEDKQKGFQLLAEHN
jgi:flagellar protein FliS